MTPPLAHLRFPPELSPGRRYQERSHPYRNDFQRDRDRIVHTRAFRRLEDKTQVFAAGYSDHFRNRLTHTIEVSQMARSVARALGLDTDLVEALALVHDIGHPPFAHAGEEELHRQMARFGAAFEHNRHALRIVEQFEQRYAAHPGLNLTFEVREGILKHSADLGLDCDPALAEYLPGVLPPLEAQLIDLADEAAYNTADLDDAHEGGLLRLAEIAEALPVVAECLEAVETQYPAAPERLQFQEMLRRLVDIFVRGLIEGTAEAAKEYRDVEAVRRAPSRLARFTPLAAELSRDMKRFLHARVYHSPELAEEREASRAAIAELFSHYLRHPERLPEGYLASDPGRPLHQAICDYIAGMTDGFFRRTYAYELSGR